MDGSTVPTFTIDLSVPARQRWRPMTKVFGEAQRFKQDVVPILTYLHTEILQGSWWLLQAVRWSTWLLQNRVLYIEELTGMAEDLNISLQDLIVLQFVYEASAACTSLICEQKDGQIHHYRTMDWQMPLLKALTINVRFVRSSQLVCQATTWVGCVGLFTAMRPQLYSAAINYRRTSAAHPNTIMSNIRRLIDGRCWPSSFLLRERLCRQHPLGFRELFLSLQQAPLVAPCYFSLAGVASGEGGSIARDPTRVVFIKHLSLTQRAICQANIDDTKTEGDDILMSRARVKAALELPAHPFPLKEFTRFPIRNELTIYANHMIPATGIYETRLF